MVLTANGLGQRYPRVADVTGCQWRTVPWYPQLALMQSAAIHTWDLEWMPSPCYRTPEGSQVGPLGGHSGGHCCAAWPPAIETALDTRLL